MEAVWGVRVVGCESGCGGAGVWGFCGRLKEEGHKEVIGGEHGAVGHIMGRQRRGRQERQPAEQTSFFVAEGHLRGS